MVVFVPIWLKQNIQILQCFVFPIGIDILSAWFGVCVGVKKINGKCTRKNRENYANKTKPRLFARKTPKKRDSLARKILKNATLCKSNVPKNATLCKKDTKTRLFARKIPKRDSLQERYPKCDSLQAKTATHLHLTATPLQLLLLLLVLAGVCVCIREE